MERTCVYVSSLSITCHDQYDFPPGECKSLDGRVGRRAMSNSNSSSSLFRERGRGEDERNRGEMRNRGEDGGGGGSGGLGIEQEKEEEEVGGGWWKGGDANPLLVPSPPLLYYLSTRIHPLFLFLFL